MSSENLSMNNDILLSLLIGCMSFEIMNKNNKEENRVVKPEDRGAGSVSGGKKEYFYG